MLKLRGVSKIMVKQITIISGKGGTGKTTVAAGLAYLAKGSAVMADADVDAPDLHLILHPEILSSTDLNISKKVIRNEDLCKKCNLCGEHCQFDAITADTYDRYKCEGCGLCVRVCPEKALTLKAFLSAKILVSNTRFGPFVHANMEIGEGSSGRIVDTVRKEARKIAEEKNLSYLIVDGSPGIGCPVIASITGVDLALIVVEPTLSGIHDLERVLDVTIHFGVKALVCINKSDLNERITQKIEKFCKENDIILAGKIPYDTIVPQSIIAYKSILEMPENSVANEIKEIWKIITETLSKE